MQVNLKCHLLVRSMLRSNIYYKVWCKPVSCIMWCLSETAPDN